MIDQDPQTAIPRLDGKITIGPVRLPRGWRGTEFMRRMEEFGLRISRDDSAGFSIRPSLGGITIHAEGAGVLGYLVDSETLDASETDLETFAQPFIGGLPFAIEGEHDLGGGKKFRCRTVIEACNVSFTGVRVVNTRELQPA